MFDNRIAGYRRKERYVKEAKKMFSPFYVVNYSDVFSSRGMMGRLTLKNSMKSNQASIGLPINGNENDIIMLGSI